MLLDDFVHRLLEHRLERNTGGEDLLDLLGRRLVQLDRLAWAAPAVVLDNFSGDMAASFRAADTADLPVPRPGA